MVGSTDRPDATRGERAQYQVRVQRCRGVWARWRGRVVTIDAAGKRRYWPTRRAHTRDRLVDALWQEAMLDIRWHSGSASASVIEMDPETPLETRAS